MSVVYVSTEVNESIESILKWNITKFNVVMKMIGKINKLKYGNTKSSNSLNVLG